METTTPHLQLLDWIEDQMNNKEHLNGHRAHFMEESVERVVHSLDMHDNEDRKRHFLVATYEGIYEKYLIKKYQNLYGDKPETIAEADALEDLLTELRKRFSFFL